MRWQKDGPRCPQVLKERNFPYSDMKMLASARWGPPSGTAGAAAPLPWPRHRSAWPGVSRRSAGQKQEFDGHTYTVEELTENRCGVAAAAPRRVPAYTRSRAGRDGAPWYYAALSAAPRPRRSFKDVDIALFSAGGSISKKLGPVAAAAGAVVRSMSGSCSVLLHARRADRLLL